MQYETALLVGYWLDGNLGEEHRAKYSSLHALFERSVLHSVQMTPNWE